MATIAFFTLNAYDMLTGGHEGEAVGGAQLQQILIGKELTKRGHDVYFVEYDTELKSERTINGIQVITKPLPSGSELSRALTAIRGTKSVLDRIEPDASYRRSLDFEILPLSFYCSLTKTRFVYGVAHDDELTESPHKFSGGIKNTSTYKWLNKQALSNASAVISQNQTQYNLAAEFLSTDIYQIPNCYESNNVDPIDWRFEPPVIFWAARFRPWKRPKVVVELAESLPEATFVMAGDVYDDLYRQLKENADSLDNLILLGHVPFADIDRYFSAADMFLNTSKAEGFPNTFLQAWAQETPVASLKVDPNNILSENQIGLVADGSVEKLQNHVQWAVNNRKELKKMGKASKEYLLENYSVDGITDRYEQSLLGRSPKRNAR